MQGQAAVCGPAGGPTRGLGWLRELCFGTPRGKREQRLGARKGKPPPVHADLDGPELSCSRAGRWPQVGQGGLSIVEAPLIERDAPEGRPGLGPIRVSEDGGPAGFDAQSSSLESARSHAACRPQAGHERCLGVGAQLKERGRPERRPELGPVRVSRGGEGARLSARSTSLKGARMGPQGGRIWRACPGLRLAAQVGLIGLVIAAVGKCIEKTRKGGVGIVSWEAWPGSAQGADWAGGGASGHAPGLVSWPTQGNMGGLSARIRQLSVGPEVPVGGGVGLGEPTGR